MLHLLDINHIKISGLINYKDLKVERELSGYEILSFSYPQYDFKHDLILEEGYIVTKENEYVIKEVNGGDGWTDIVAKVNIEGINGKVFDSFETIGQNCTNTVNLALVGTGWTIGSCNISAGKVRTIKKSNCSSYEILQEIAKMYFCNFKFDAINKKLYIYQSMGSNRGSYFSDELNLRKLTTQSNSHSFITRLIPIGKDGLKINSVNGNKEYVENYQYSTKIITAYWEESRYETAQSLKDDAILKLAELSKPMKSYSVDIVDLARANGGVYYNILDYELGDTIKLISKDKNIKELLRIVKTIEYPDEPERNSCEIASRIPRFEDIQVNVIQSMDRVDRAITSDGMINLSKVNFDPLREEVATSLIQKANISDLTAAVARIGTLEVTTATITQLNVVDARITNLRVTTAMIDTAQIKTAHIDTAQITSALIANLAVTTAHIADATITSAKIGNAQITSAHIGTAQITTAHIGDAQITTAKIGNAQITSAHIGNAEIKTAHIGDAEITSAKIANLAVTTAKIGDAQITSAKIGNAEIKTANIADANITTAKIGLAQITTALIADANITTAKIGNAQITTAKIGLAQITTALIADAQITSVKIGTAEIKTANIDNAAITTAKIGLAQITTALIADAQITSVKIGLAEIKTANIDNAAITAAKIGLAQIQTAHIADGQITTAKIGTAQITSALIGSAEIKTANIANGAITSALIGSEAVGTANIQNGSITDAKIVNLSVGKILAGDISTDKFTVVSDSGNLKIQGNVLKVWDDSGKERISLGLNGSDYNLLVRGTDGTTVLFGNTGVTNAGITEGAVDDSKVASNANINGGKIEKESLITQINGATTTVQSNRIKLDSENQTLDVAFTTLKTTTTNTANTVNNQGTSINTIQGQISSKIWNVDITTAVNNIQIGGRNLLKLSDVPITTTAYRVKTYTMSIPMVEGEIYTVSLKATFEAGRYIWVYCNNGTKSLASITTVAGEQTYNITFIGKACNNIIEFYNAPSGSSSATITWVKLEEGNKATDWTPAPEDVQSQIDSQETRISSTESSITQLNNSITLKVETSTFNSTVSTINTNIAAKANQTDLNTTNSNLTSITTRVSTAESSITTLQNQIILKVTQTDIDTSINNFRTMVKLNGTELLNLKFMKDASTVDKPFASGTYTIVPATEVGGSANSANYIKTINTQYLYSPYIACNPTGTQYFKMAVYNLDTNTGVIYVQCCYYDKDKVAIAANEAALNLISGVSLSAANVWNTFEGYIDPLSDSDVRQKAMYMRIRVLTRYSTATGTTYLKDLTWKQLASQTIATSETRMTTAESSITALNNSITLKVNSTDFTSYQTTNNANITSITTRVSTAESSITALQNQITLKVSQTDIDNSINEIQIGGRNLLKDSQHINTYPNNVGLGTSVLMSDESIPYYRTTGTSHISTYGDDSSSTATCFTIPMEIGGLYTVSVDIRIPVAGDVCLFNGIHQQTISTINKWIRISYTYTYSEGYRIIGLVYDESNSIDYRNWKIEKGDKATDWTPAPEDVQGQIDSATSRISTAESSISIQAGQISSKVDNNGVISAINQTAEIIKIQASKIEISGSVTLANLLHPSDNTKIDGGDIYTGSITASQIATGAITAGSAIIATAAISSAQIASIDAAKITTGYLSANRIQASTITSDKLHVLAKSFVNNFSTYGYSEGQTVIDGWTQIGGTSGVTINKTQTIVPVVGATARSVDSLLMSTNATNGHNLQLNSTMFEIDPKKNYKIKVAIKSESLSSKYFGLTVYNSAGVNIGCYAFNVSNRTISSTLNTNPYFWNNTKATTPSSDWLWLEGYVMAVNTKADKMPMGTNVQLNYILPPDAKFMAIRLLNYNSSTSYGDGITSTAYFYSPSVTELDGGTIYADNIYGGTLTLGGASNGNGLLSVVNASGTQIGKFDNVGVTLLDGKFKVVETFDTYNKSTTVDADMITLTNNNTVSGVYENSVLTGAGLALDTSIPSQQMWSYSWLGAPNDPTDGANCISHLRFMDGGAIRIKPDVSSNANSVLIDSNGKMTVTGIIAAGSYVLAANSMSTTSQLVGDYTFNGTANKMIWSIGTNYMTWATHYGFAYEYGTVSTIANQHAITFRSAGVTQAKISLNRGDGEFNGVVMASGIVSTDYLAGARIGITNTDASTGRGISLYNGATTGMPLYGLAFAFTSVFGTHGYVTGDYSTYFTMNSTSGRGWIFRNASTPTNVASISNTGYAQFNGDVKVGTYFRTTGGSAFGSQTRASQNCAIVNVGTYYFEVRADGTLNFSDDSTLREYVTTSPTVKKFGSNATQLTYTIGAGTTYAINNTTSDRRLKRNIKDALETGSLAKIVSIRHREFDWIETGDKVKMGYVAQELALIDSEFVVRIPQPEGSKFKELYKINEMGLLPHITKAIQELKAIIDDQAKELAYLKTKVIA